tara:strand:- start:51 stop:416 length:366 start_codon:yes stop_codon:yes gene_type:complete
MGVLMFLFVLVCIFLLAIILLQSSKGGGMGSAISGQSMNDAFGGEGADKLMVRITRILAFVFMGLAIWIGKQNNSGEPMLDQFGGSSKIDNADTTRIQNQENLLDKSLGQKTDSSDTSKVK